MKALVNTSDKLVVQQVKEWGEIIVNWETVNRYRILDAQENEVGFVAERYQGFLTTIGRQVLRSHRPFKVDIFNATRQVVVHLSRSFFFFFSDMLVATPQGITIGNIRRRFAIFSKKYDLCDDRGVVFATVKSPIWRIWKFPILDIHGNERGSISKKWGGILKEVFTDADQFFVDYGQQPWTDNQRTVILATAISIDFDFFEDNTRRN